MAAPRKPREGRQSWTLTGISALESSDLLGNGGFIIVGSSYAISSISVTFSLSLVGSSSSDAFFLSPAFFACPGPFLLSDSSFTGTPSSRSAGSSSASAFVSDSSSSSWEGSSGEVSSPALSPYPEFPFFSFSDSSCFGAPVIGSSETSSINSSFSVTSSVSL